MEDKELQRIFNSENPSEEASKALNETLGKMPLKEKIWKLSCILIGLVAAILFIIG